MRNLFKRHIYYEKSTQFHKKCVTLQPEKRKIEKDTYIS